MAALTAQRQTASKALGTKHSLPVAASTTVYAGSMVSITTDGYAVPAEDNTDRRGCFGVATETIDNSAGSDGEKSVVIQEGIFLVNNLDSMVSQSDLGTIVMVGDDQSVTTNSMSSYSVIAGTLVQYVSNSEVWVNFAPSQYQQV